MTKIRKRDRTRADVALRDAATSVDYTNAAAVLDRIVADKIFGMTDTLCLQLSAAVMRERAVWASISEQT